MIVVTGPTGTIGKRVLENVLKSSEPIRVIARDPFSHEKSMLILRFVGAFLRHRTRGRNINRSSRSVRCLYFRRCTRRAAMTDSVAAKEMLN
jgi:NAD dependent epimerase/dehydratase family enzyme